MEEGEKGDDDENDDDDEKDDDEDDEDESGQESEERGKARGDSPTAHANRDEEVAAEMFVSAIREIDDELKECLRLRRRHLVKFNLLRKVLTIVLNERLMKMAIFGSSVVRKVSNYFIHKYLKVDDHTFEALSRSADLTAMAWDETGQKIDATQIKEIAEDADALRNIMYRSDDYLAKGDTTLEQQLDDFFSRDEQSRRRAPEGMAKKSMRKEFEKPVRRDLHVLLDWLDTLERRQ